MMTLYEPKQTQFAKRLELLVAQYVSHDPSPARPRTTTATQS